MQQQKRLLATAPKGSLASSKMSCSSRLRLSYMTLHRGRAQSLDSKHHTSRAAMGAHRAKEVHRQLLLQWQAARGSRWKLSGKPHTPLRCKRELNGRKGSRTFSKNEHNEDDRNAIGAYMQDLKERSGCTDSMMPCCQLVNICKFPSQISELCWQVTMMKVGDMQNLSLCGVWTAVSKFPSQAVCWFLCCLQ